MLSARRAYQLSGLAGLLVAAVLGYQAIRLPYYTRIGPGPGFFPRWLCGILALLSLAILARATRGRDAAAARHRPPRPAGGAPDRRRRRRPVPVAAVTTTLGFRLTMLTFYLVVIGMLGRWRWIETPVLAVLGSFAAYYILVEWLKLPLPVGVLGF